MAKRPQLVDLESTWTKLGSISELILDEAIIRVLADNSLEPAVDEVDTQLTIRRKPDQCTYRSMTAY